MNIYIACALTHVPRAEFQAYSDLLHLLAATLQAAPNNHQVQYALINSDPQLADKAAKDRAKLCYLWDHKMVESAELILAEASYPSVGLGIELQIACDNDIPIIIFFSEESRHRAKPVEYKNPDQSHHQLQIGEGYVSLMALGLPNIFHVLRYSKMDDALPQILKAISMLEKS